MLSFEKSLKVIDKIDDDAGTAGKNDPLPIVRVDLSGCLDSSDVDAHLKDRLGVSAAQRLIAG
ncbi:MAG TPA: hypothetical protein DCL95_14150 [Rhodospirillaceae bacterium]|nr:hypothetical protein [Rhodospirillaceae bacterium]MAX61050.1 hypothetical protein [Rhodospirillaceae bacterium]MBB55791.1 hypothetical protein [Rhodospirillaceae bacterium]HAE02058.1 hypothetical protein [Rhodospirillaceae bacterium]HAJ21173.1 hypothetical protein [Rhodospirillaceae bacterium]|tara:strand:+ start:699 stop:887 length:189 start_codon:yes stop_codon:yes gene_type:complete